MLQAAGLTVRPGRNGALTVDGATDPSAVTRMLADQGLYLTELTPVTVDLETVFLELTSGAAATTAPAETPAAPEEST